MKTFAGEKTILVNEYVRILINKIKSQKVLWYNDLRVIP